MDILIICISTLSIVISLATLLIAAADGDL